MLRDYGNIIKIIAALATIATFLINAFTGWFPKQSLIPFLRHTISHISTNSDFSIDAVKTDWKITLTPGDSFNYKYGVPLTARGTTKLKDSEYVWVLVVDQHGNYYLQNPPVTIRSGIWHATNIRPLENIKRIVFLKVNEEGNRSFQNMVAHGEYGKILNMPVDREEVSFITLE